MKDNELVHDDEYYYSIIRKNVKKYRKEKKLTQQELADMTDLSREYICDIENESRNKHLTSFFMLLIFRKLFTEIFWCVIVDTLQTKDMKGIEQFSYLRW